MKKRDTIMNLMRDLDSAASSPRTLLTSSLRS